APLPGRVRGAGADPAHDHRGRQPGHHQPERAPLLLPAAAPADLPPRRAGRGRLVRPRRLGPTPRPPHPPPPPRHPPPAVPRAPPAAGPRGSARAAGPCPPPAGPPTVSGRPLTPAPLPILERGLPVTPWSLEPAAPARLPAVTGSPLAPASPPELRLSEEEPL